MSPLELSDLDDEHEHEHEHEHVPDNGSPASLHGNSESASHNSAIQSPSPTQLTQLAESSQDAHGTMMMMAMTTTATLSPALSPPLSPPPVLPWGRLLPCSPLNQAYDLMPRPSLDDHPNHHHTHNHHLDHDVTNVYWIGRSAKCDITASKKVPHQHQHKPTAVAMYAWAHSMISNRHCRIYTLLTNDNTNTNTYEVYIEDHSGNGTVINQTTLLRKGDKRLLHSGDEICLVHSETLQKKIRSLRLLQPLLQQYSFVFVQQQQLQPQLQQPSPYSSLAFHPHTTSNNTKTQKQPCVNPRAMNYHHHHHHHHPNNNHNHTQSSFSNRRIEAEYDLRNVIGDGTSGQVRKAIHRASGAIRAVKIISLRRYQNNIDWKQLEQEANILQRLNHPYIVHLYDVFITPGVAMYLVMEYVPGGDLFDRIVQKTSYGQVEARQVIRRLFAAVYYLHQECHIVHRDLKPENILLLSTENDTHVQLTDFGLAKQLPSRPPGNNNNNNNQFYYYNDLEACKTFCGTPQYFAPEVYQRRHTVQGRGRYGKPADMWSLGVILYILLAGQPPFEPTFYDDDQNNHNSNHHHHHHDNNNNNNRNEHVDAQHPSLQDDDRSISDEGQGEPNHNRSSHPFTAVFAPDPWNDMPLAKDLVQKLLQKDPKRRLSITQACNHPWILTEDGDTHVHPLLDPAVTCSKRLFDTSHDDQRQRQRQAVDQQSNMDGTTSISAMNTDDTNTPPMATEEHNQETSMDVDQTTFTATTTTTTATTSTTTTITATSKVAAEQQQNPCYSESLPAITQPDFATAANTCYGRHTTSSVLPMDLPERDETTQQRSQQPAPLLENNDQELLEQHPLGESPKIRNALVIPANRTLPVKESYASPMDDDHHYQEQRQDEHQNPDKHGQMICATMVTPLETESPSPGGRRSPLWALSLNERSNRFRQQVLSKTQASNKKESCGTATDDATLARNESNPSDSPPDERKNDPNPKVTPVTTGSNRNHAQRHLSALTDHLSPIRTTEHLNDDVCSRFSSDVTESLESFPSSTAGSPNRNKLQKQNQLPSTLEGGQLTRKRSRQADNERGIVDNMDGSDDNDSRKKKKKPKKSQRQTTLSGWFVKKQLQPPNC